MIPLTEGDKLGLRAIVAYMIAMSIGAIVAGAGGAISATIGVFCALVILDPYLEWGDNDASR